jgi:hypothetical protein
MKQPYETPAIVAAADVVPATRNGHPVPGEGITGLGAVGAIGFSL